jgi:hypothetical protein
MEWCGATQKEGKEKALREEAEREETLRQEAEAEAKAEAEREAVEARARRIARDKEENLKLLRNLQEYIKRTKQEREEGLKEWREKELQTKTRASSNHSRRNTELNNKVISGLSDTREPNKAIQATSFLMKTKSLYQN